MNKTMLPLNLQLFAEGAGVQQTQSGNQQQAAGTTQTGATAASTGDPQNNVAGAANAQIDYNKIQTMLNGTLAAKEDTVLKAYFKQQGLTEEEMKQAIQTFKDQKAKNQPDIPGLQAKITNAEAVARKYLVENKATLAALQLGLDAKTIPYVIKMADMSKVIGSDGNVDDAALTTALNKVLEDIPQLKPQTQMQQGFVQVGAVVNPQQTQTQNQGTQKNVPSKTWNRFNH